MPPLAAVLDVNGVGTAPGAMVWFDPIDPARSWSAKVPPAVPISSANCRTPLALLWPLRIASVPTGEEYCAMTE